ncbi:hypothetical protein CC806_24765 [Salmonella enterica subsp. enterica serovar Braenderup]|nr:hypothetical protein [Salmonella enterica subsp. enterica serovar Braenderup]
MKILLAILGVAALIFFSAVGLWVFDIFSFREAMKASIIFTGFSFVIFEALAIFFTIIVATGAWFASSPTGKVYATGIALFLMSLLMSRFTVSIPAAAQICGISARLIFNLSMLVPVVIYIAFALWYVVTGRFKHYGY